MTYQTHWILSKSLFLYYTVWHIKRGDQKSLRGEKRAGTILVGTININDNLVLEIFIRSLMCMYLFDTQPSFSNAEIYVIVFVFVCG